MKKEDKDWIEYIWPGYHDNCHDDTIMSFFNNSKELDRLNKYRNENTSMDLFNKMLIVALWKRNSDLSKEFNTED